MAEYKDADKLKQAIINTPLKALEGKDYNKEVFDTATDIIHEILDIIDEQPTVEYVVRKDGGFI